MKLKRHHIAFAAGILAALSLAACRQQPSAAEEAASEAQPSLPDPRPVSREFKEYWYAGTAELTSYTLSQARYGELHDGHAVLVYVTEPFDPEKQVKADRPDSTSVSVLKLNRSKKFLTGIYPYSIMSSIFYPVSDNRHALKLTTSVQEWCGHIYTQLNNRDQFQVQAFSYFESDGDQELTLDKTVTEDELWTKLRIAPDGLPTGSHAVLPSLEFLRLRHMPIRAYDATLTLSEPAQQRTYTITYPELNRTMQIHFQGQFPYAIQGWTETYSSGFGPEAPVLTTTARVKKTWIGPYWQEHSNEDLPLRDSLGL